MKIIKFFKTSSGHSPVVEFLDSLSPKQAQKITWVMRLFEEIDPMPSQYFQKMVKSDGIWEIRAQLGSDIFRVFGFFKNDNTFIATNGLRKKTQKTPRNEITLAQERKLAYLKAKEKKHE
jgi:phage-related protein